MFSTSTNFHKALANSSVLPYNAPPWPLMCDLIVYSSDYGNKSYLLESNTVPSTIIVTPEMFRIVCTIDIEKVKFSGIKTILSRSCLLACITAL
jgi:hypothetical protein